ncbi:hypothetical protein [Streptomyces rhizosphaerihabitans]|uniref:hypothetical protein n=1 Tax=Streptomyces rhizosphaerihabitans TaxID=1266770 RepID=UPI0021BE3EA4|nr:hypothetical protein [Streptomyces rhizosphaerihabitans]MCT9004006.1 hypothetical protein [Streptomyces rhizosphaerihabitans]
MEAVPEAEETSGPWFAGFRLGALLGVPTSLVAVLVIGRVWASCGIGVNASANSLSLLLVAPVVWIGTAASWTLVHGAIGRFGRGAVVAVGVLFNLWFLWYVVTALGTMGSYPDPVCPGNVPPWWPGFVPA